MGDKGWHAFLHPKLTKVGEQGAWDHIVVVASVIRDLLAFKCGLRAASARGAWRAFIVSTGRCGAFYRAGRANGGDNLGFQYVKVLLSGQDLTGRNALISATVNRHDLGIASFKSF